MSIFKELSSSLEQATGYFEGKENSTKVTHIEFARPDVFTVRHWSGPGADQQTGCCQNYRLENCRISSS